MLEAKKPLITSVFAHYKIASVDDALSVMVRTSFGVQGHLSLNFVRCFRRYHLKK